MPPKDDAAAGAADLTNLDTTATADSAGAGDVSGDATVQTPTLQPDAAPSTTAAHPAGYATIQLRAPEGVNAISWAGVEYDVNDDGIIELPLQAEHDLKAHGFEVI